MSVSSLPAFVMSDGGGFPSKIPLKTVSIFFARNRRKNSSKVYFAFVIYLLLSIGGERRGKEGGEKTDYRMLYVYVNVMHKLPVM